jgi:hypothetical protein
MDPARKLAEGVAGWLMYEFQCDRSELFNERYLSTAVSDVLNSIYGEKIHAEFVHPTLAGHTAGPGRRPEIDFAVVADWPKPLCVVETKWMGKNLLSADEIIWDLLRLELAAFNSDCDAFFVVAGRSKYFNKFFASKAFLGTKNKKGKYRRLLKLDKRKNARLRIDNPPADRIPVYKRLFAAYQKVAFPSRVTTSICQSYPTKPWQYQYVVYAWRVLPCRADPRFKPENSVLFQL